jgi:hypothetical protein
MRDRIIMAGYILGALAIVAGLIVYNNLDSEDVPAPHGPSERIEAGEGTLIDIGVLNVILGRREEAAQPVAETKAPLPVQTRMSPAGGAAPAAVIQPAFVYTPPPTCAPSLLGSVLGLLGGLLGGRGGC